MKHKFIFIGKEYLAPSIPYKLIVENGHECVYFLAPTNDKGKKFHANETYHNMDLPIITDPKEAQKYIMSKDWTRVVEDTTLTKWVKGAIAKGLPTLCGYSDVEKWETDREYGQKICEYVRKKNFERGLDYPNFVIPQRAEFTDFDQAIEFIQENEGPFVLKESGDSSVRALNYKGELKNGMDVIVRLNHLKENGMGSEKNVKFTLQKRVDGIETSVSAFFNGVDFMNFTIVDFEHQPLLDGERGPNTGEMFNEAIAMEKEENILYKMVFEPLIPLLRKKGFHGFMNMNGTITKEGYHPFEWTIRMAGTPWVFQVWEWMEGVYDYGEFLYQMATGGMNPIKYKDGITLGVRVDTPPSVFGGVSADLLQKTIEENPKKMDEFVKTANTKDPEKISGLLNDEYSLFNENAKDMPLLISDLNRFVEKRLHFDEARDWQVFQSDGQMYGIFYATGYCTLYFTCNAVNEKAVKKMADSIIDRISGLRFITRSDYGEKVMEKLTELEALGYNLCPHA